MTNASNNTAPDPSRLTKSSSRLSKTLTFRSNKSKTKAPKSEKTDSMCEESKLKYPGRVDKKHQEMLKAFEWKFGRRTSDGGTSQYSGISPGTSRNASVDSGALHRVLSGRKSGHYACGPGGLSNEVHAEKGSGGGTAFTEQAIPEDTIVR